MNNWQIMGLAVVATIWAGLMTYSLSYWAARGWYDGKNKRHG